jgi:hypothetical protein
LVVKIAGMPFAQFWTEVTHEATTMFPATFAAGTKPGM